MRCTALMAAATVATLAFWSPARAQASDAPKDARPMICKSHELLAYMRKIKQACNDITCDFKKLKEIDENVDKPTLLAALRSPYLHPVHIFFPVGKTALNTAFDWNSTKRSQLGSLKTLEDPQNSVIFVLGQASAKGSHDLNINLSEQRMQSVMSYLTEIGVQCKKIHGAFLGREIFQLSASDASFLYIPADDFREDPFVLNQSVHLFVFPCADLL